MNTWRTVIIKEMTKEIFPSQQNYFSLLIESIYQIPGRIAVERCIQAYPGEVSDSENRKKTLLSSETEKKKLNTEKKFKLSLHFLSLMLEGKRTV